MATVIERNTPTEVEATPETGHRRMSTFGLIVGFLLVGLLGFGLGWLAFRDTGTDVPDEIEQLVEDWSSAWSAGDGDAVVALMTPAGRHYDSGTSRGIRGDDLVTLVDGLGVNDRIDVTEVEAFMGEDPFVLVASGTVYGDEGVSVFEIIDRNGEMRIATHRWVS